ncbi:MAG: type VI secretion system tube protein Hcp [Sterolibacteriaceae bacterium]|jgi:type VI secretion system secreted protein Hcp|uniref:Type VI secretion system tube protein Hcp n=1 Tax=Candidatus Methylophosphatis roskildensis TaxID=2899263 RepID=A0A9D7HK90_9PROT|nr:type VI secretion system tube protein Hcp [Candidatus Methylophosphatis roskildensis]MBK7234252.1 type VI secretion system tube protein Hcp [Sterolibacteriaceae bacterium]MBK7662415.1 type VI secretion system tube protein Hcp [Sterolibacteriaceae bacterium]MBK9086530.1 type VI secretion system tube protein Hcp [Sterolibacteriaceae bacterium]
MAIGDSVIKIDGVDGESAAAGREGHIDVLGWNWGMSWNAGLFQGSGKGGADVRNLTFEHFVDAASPALMNHCVGGKVISKVVLKQYKAGATPLLFFTITLEEARVTSMDDGLAGVEAQPTERVTLAFRKVTVEHSTQAKTGSGTGTKTFNWVIRDQS